MNKQENDKQIISLFPLPEIVLFPGMNLPLYVFEERYITMIENAIKGKNQFGVVLAKGDMCAEVGTIAEVVNFERIEEGRLNILTEGKSRFKIIKFITEEPYYVAEVGLYEDKAEKDDDNLKKNIKDIKILSKKALKIYDKVSEQRLSKALKLPDDITELLFLVSGNLTCSHEQKQVILETVSVKDRASKILHLLKEEIERLEVLLENKKTKEQVIKNGKIHI